MSDDDEPLSKLVIQEPKETKSAKKKDDKLLSPTQNKEEKKPTLKKEKETPKVKKEEKEEEKRSTSVKKESKTIVKNEAKTAAISSSVKKEAKSSKDKQKLQQDDFYDSNRSLTTKKGAKVIFDKPGQRRPTPTELDVMRLFYESMYNEIPDSEMAEKWCLVHGLLDKSVALKLPLNMLERKTQLQLRSPRHHRHQARRGKHHHHHQAKRKQAAAKSLTKNPKLNRRLTKNKKLTNKKKKTQITTQTMINLSLM